MNTIGLQSIVFIVACLIMFLTSINARDPMMSALAGEDQHVWTYLNLTSARPWFLASFRVETPESEITETVFLAYVEQVCDLLRQQQDDFQVTQLLLVSPGWLNESGNWLMQPLQEIWLGDRGIGRAYMYCLPDGTQYIDSAASKDLPFLPRERLAVFHASPQSSVLDSRHAQ